MARMRHTTAECSVVEKKMALAETAPKRHWYSEGADGVPHS